MDPLVVVLIAVAVVILIVLALRSRGAPGRVGPVAPATPTVDDGGLHPPASSFHVSGGEAHVEFAVPVPVGDVDPVLRDILLAEAVEVLRSKRGKLPMAGVSRVHAYADREGRPVMVGTLSLDGPGELPPPAPPGMFHLGRGGADIFDELSVFDDPDAPMPAVDSRVPADELPPLAGEMRLTAMQDAGLRTQGIDPATAPASHLVSGLLRLAGYSIDGEGHAFTATRDGVAHYVEVVEHRPGSHPELSERAIDEFVVRFGSSRAGRGLLFTPKYGSFMCYDRERRQPRLRFVTRERFQTFVNSAALG
ncbi:MAG: hypothetical protein ABWY62_05665 [Acidimicrobiia bacterium]